MSQWCHLMSTYCVRGLCWGLSFISSSLTALVNPGWLTHDQSTAAYRVQPCAQVTQHGRGGAGARPWDMGSLCCPPAAPGGHEL